MQALRARLRASEPIDRAGEDEILTRFCAERLREAVSAQALRGRLRASEPIDRASARGGRGAGAASVCARRPRGLTVPAAGQSTGGISTMPAGAIVPCSHWPTGADVGLTGIFCPVSVVPSQCRRNRP